MLTMQAMSASQQTVVGVSGEALLQKKKLKELLQPLVVRMKNVQFIMQLINPNVSHDIFELVDPFGPTITNAAIEAIVASEETISGCKKINDIRQQSQMSPLAILLIHTVTPKYNTYVVLCMVTTYVVSN